jgi:hypothetical protein
MGLVETKIYIIFRIKTTTPVAKLIPYNAALKSRGSRDLVGILKEMARHATFEPVGSQIDTCWQLLLRRNTAAARAHRWPCMANACC